MIKLKKGDLVTYRCGKTNYVNNVKKYKIYYDDKFNNCGLGRGYSIVKVQRYVKFLCFYRLKTIYERGWIK